MNDINLIKETEKTRIERYLEQKPKSERDFEYVVEENCDNYKRIGTKNKEGRIKSE